MNAATETIDDLFDLELELVDEPATASDKERCLHTAYQSTCGGIGCHAQA